MSVNQLFGYAFGAVYVLIGLVGFAVTGFDGFAHHEGELLLGVFEVNPLHDVVLIAIGGAFIAGAAGGLRSARPVNLAGPAPGRPPVPSPRRVFPRDSAAP